MRLARFLAVIPISLTAPSCGQPASKGDPGPPGPPAQKGTRAPKARRGGGAASGTVVSAGAFAVEESGQTKANACQLGRPRSASRWTAENKIDRSKNDPDDDGDEA
jgi:hypothetical protein